jgi:hypothetical protein
VPLFLYQVHRHTYRPSTAMIGIEDLSMSYATVSPNPNGLVYSSLRELIAQWIYQDICQVQICALLPSSRTALSLWDDYYHWPCHANIIMRLSIYNLLHFYQGYQRRYAFYLISEFLPTVLDV